MRIAWCSDLHINFAGPQAIRRFTDEVRRVDADMLVVCGDISGGYNLRDALACLWLDLNVPVRFALGNHDYYRLSFAQGHALARLAVDESPILHDDVRALSWLSEGVIKEVSDDTALIGHDGWYNARAGLLRNRVIISDFNEIKDLRSLSAHARVPEPMIMKIRKIADESAAYFDRVLPPALAKRPRVVLATRVAPFPHSDHHDQPPAIAHGFFRGVPDKQHAGDVGPRFSWLVSCASPCHTSITPCRAGCPYTALAVNTRRFGRIQASPSPALPVDADMPGEHQFVVAGNDVGDALSLVVFKEPRFDWTEEVRGRGIGDTLLLPIWRH